MLTIRWATSAEPCDTADSLCAGGCIPIAPHLYFTRFLDETNPQDRELGLFMGRVLLTKCVELWVFGSRVTAGMEREIAKAEERSMPIRYFTEDMEERQDG